MGGLRPCLFSVTRRDIRAAYAVAGYALTMAALAWAVMRGAEASGYSWQWYRIPALSVGYPANLMKIEFCGYTLFIDFFHNPVVTSVKYDQFRTFQLIENLLPHVLVVC